MDSEKRVSQLLVSEMRPLEATFLPRCDFDQRGEVITVWLHALRPNHGDDFIDDFLALDFTVGRRVKRWILVDNDNEMGWRLDKKPAVVVQMPVDERSRCERCQLGEVVT